MVPSWSPQYLQGSTMTPSTSNHPDYEQTFKFPQPAHPIGYEVNPHNMFHWFLTVKRSGMCEPILVLVVVFNVKELRLNRFGSSNQ